MFRSLSRSGWDRLPTSLLERIKLTVGDDFRSLNKLVDKNGLFREDFFKQRDYGDEEVQVNWLASLLRDLGYKLGEHEKFTDAEVAFNISLKLKPTDHITIAGLAHLYVYKGDFEKADLYAKEALGFLWLSRELYTNNHKRIVQRQLSKIITEAHLQEFVGEQFLEKVRSIIQGYQMTPEQEQHLVLATSAICNREYEEGLTQFRQVTADVFFDAADQLTFQRIQNVQENNLAGVHDTASVALAATKLDPNHIDAWVLASHLYGMKAILDEGSELKAFAFSLEALERIDSYIAGNNTLHSKDPVLTLRSNDPSQVTRLLVKTLRANAEVASELLRSRASKYLT